MAGGGAGMGGMPQQTGGMGQPAQAGGFGGGFGGGYGQMPQQTGGMMQAPVGLGYGGVPGNTGFPAPQGFGGMMPATMAPQVQARPQGFNPTYMDVKPLPGQLQGMQPASQGRTEQDWKNYAANMSFANQAGYDAARERFMGGAGGMMQPAGRPMGDTFQGTAPGRGFGEVFGAMGGLGGGRPMNPYTVDRKPLPAGLPQVRSDGIPQTRTAGSAVTPKTLPKGMPMPIQQNVGRPMASGIQSLLGKKK